MKKFNVLVYLLIATLLLSGCSNGFLGAGDFSEPESVMVKGKLVDLKYDDEKFTFAFTDSQNQLYSNREMKIEYEIFIDESLSEPEVEYEMIVYSEDEQKEVGNKPWENPLRRLVVIKLSHDDYYKVFGDSAIDLQKN